MNIHRFECDTDRYGVLAPEEASDSAWVIALDGRSFADSWQSQKAVVADDHKGAITDIGDVTILGVVPVVSERAVIAIGGVLREFGELLPIDVESIGRMFVYNVTNVVDCLNKKATKGFWLDADRLADANEYVFRPERVSHAGVFRIPEQLSWPIFLTTEIVAAIEKCELRGLSTPIVWRG